jgi:[ribosomal protein S18]-alanine N-acetyltransferase
VGYLSCRVPDYNDIPALVALDQRTLGGLWSAEGYGREIDSPNSSLLMLVHQAPENQAQPGSGQRAVSDRPTTSTARPQNSLSLPVYPRIDLEASAGEPELLGTDLAGADLTLADPHSAVAESPLWGLGCYWAILEEAHITVLPVDPRYQRRGLGQWLLVQLLLSACSRSLQRATLEVRPSNSRALALYESFGFETLGRRRRYYADGEDALILWQNSLKTAEFRDRLQRRYQQTRERLERQGWQIQEEKMPVIPT